MCCPPFYQSCLIKRFQEPVFYQAIGDISSVSSEHSDFGLVELTYSVTGQRPGVSAEGLSAFFLLAFFLLAGTYVGLALHEHLEIDAQLMPLLVSGLR